MATKYIKNKTTGKFAGSIGDGKTRIPTSSSPRPSFFQRFRKKATQPVNEEATLTEPTPTPNYLLRSPEQELDTLLNNVAPELDKTTEELEHWFDHLVRTSWMYSDHVSPDEKYRYDLNPGLPQDENTIKALKRIGYEAYLNQKLPVFVYGTLRSGQGNRRIMASSVTDYKLASIKGIGIYNGDYSFPYAKEHDDPEAIIIGELTWLSDDKEGATARSRLDRLEGFNADQPELSHYDRALKEVTITNSEGKQETHKAWIFLAQGTAKDQLHERDRVRNGDWVKSGRGAMRDLPHYN